MENLQISWLKWKKFPLPAVVFGPPLQIGPAAPPNGDAAQESRTEATAGQAMDHKPPGWVQYYADCFYSKNCCCYWWIGKNTIFLWGQTFLTIFHFLLQHSLCSQFYPATSSNHSPANQGMHIFPGNRRNQLPRVTNWFLDLCDWGLMQITS